MVGAHDEIPNDFPFSTCNRSKRAIDFSANAANIHRVNYFNIDLV